MSDRAIVALAVVAAAVAFAAPPVHPAAALLFVALWAVSRRPELLAVALLVLVGGRAHQSLAALEAPLPLRLEGTGQLASDPERSTYGTRAVVRLDGRRYLAEVPAEHAGPLGGALTGEEVHLRGRTSALRNAPRGWVRSQHLAGRLSVGEVRRAGSGPPWHRAVNALHRTLAAGAESLGARRPLYLGLVIGDDRGQDDLTRFRFEAAGMTHLLAVSGSNVAFVLAVFAPLTTRLGRRGRLVAALVVLVAFSLLTRAEPSVLRASVMAGVALLAVTTGRLAPAARILAVTVTGLLVADPLMVHSLGFQLSVAATAGLVVGVGPLSELLPGPVWVRLPLAVTVAAQVATAPLVLVVNGALPSVAVLANLLAGPAAGAVMVLGATAGVFAGLVGERTATIVQLPARLCVQWIDGVATWSSRLPFPLLGPWHLLGVAVLVLAWWLCIRRTDGPDLRAAVLCCAAAAVVLVGPLLGWGGPPVGAHHLVDGASAHHGACGAWVLELDGARDRRGMLRALWRLGVRRLDVVVTGGGRADASAAALVGEQFPVGAVVTTAERAPPGVLQLAGRRLSVGGLLVATGGPEAALSAPSVVQEPRCSVAP